MKRCTEVFLVVSLVLSAGCADPGRTTAVGAATGSVIGAGLGAIVGNQVGSAGAGLAIGAASGAAAGAAVGNALEGQENRMALQDEKLKRQEEEIRLQQSKISELKRQQADAPAAGLARAPSQDSYAWGNRAWNPSGDTDKWAPEPSVRYATTAEIAKAQARHPHLGTVSRMPADARARLATERPAPIAAAAPPVVEPALPAQPGAGALNTSTDDCETARTEIAKATAASESADKLFHIRRALRLCPSNPDYHNELGELYRYLGRTDDARFEFKEALRLNPAHSKAKENLDAL